MFPYSVSNKFSEEVKEGAEGGIQTLLAWIVSECLRSGRTPFDVFV